MNGEPKPQHWPLPADFHKKIDAALDRLSDAGQCFGICRKLGMPAEQGEQTHGHLVDFLTAARQHFFPHHP